MRSFASLRMRGRILKKHPDPSVIWFEGRNEVIGILFYGPEVFDSLWAKRIIKELKDIDEIKCILAGKNSAMGKAAVIDSELSEIEFFQEKPSQCLRVLSNFVRSLIIVTYGKSQGSGLALGKMVFERSGVNIPLIQLECNTQVWVERVKGIEKRIIEALEKMEFRQRLMPEFQTKIWEKAGRTFRRLEATSIDDFVLIEGILVGKVIAKEVIIISEDGRIVDVKGVNVKPHGFQHLEKLGKLNIATMKIASKSSLRLLEYLPKPKPLKGKGTVFIDHNATSIYDLARDVEGVVTVGDDTTAIAGELMYRFQIPVIGIVDGDEDNLFNSNLFAKNSLKITVKFDDGFGEKVFSEVFGRRQRIKKPFKRVCSEILAIGRDEIITCTRLSSKAGLLEE